MKYMLLIYGTESAWTEEERKACMLESMEICDRLAVEGKFVDSAPLHPVSTATCLRVRDGKRQITDGPFAETTEQLGGYYVIDVENLDQALEVAAELPPAQVGTVEIRPLFPLPERAEEQGPALRIERLLPVTVESVFRCWTEPELLVKWFTPAPWKTVDCVLDPRPGGEFTTVMQGPEGPPMRNTGVYLEVVKNRALRFTDAFKPGWIPAGKPFMTGSITLADEGGQTRYLAEALHWNEEDARKHAKMGFFEGWNKAADQLVEVAGSLLPV